MNVCRINGILFLGVFVLFINVAYAVIRPPHVQTATRYGADTKVIFHVIDDHGVAVTNANVGVGFYLNKAVGKNPTVCGKTDANGYFTAECKSVGEVTYSVRKEGYYQTSNEIDFRNRFNWGDCVKDNKWQPFGKVYEVVLKPRKNPITMICRVVNKPNTPLKQKIGFDLEVGDYVAPHGKGKVVDFFIFIDEQERIDMFRVKISLRLSFPNVMDGAYRKAKDEYSYFKSDYHANTNTVFRKEFVFDVNTLAKRARNYTSTSLKETEYLVLRTRTKINEKGDLIEARYTKIYGKMTFGGQHFYMQYYMNPTINDINLECESEVPLNWK